MSDSNSNFIQSGAYGGLDHPNCWICDRSNFHELFVAPIQKYQGGAFDVDGFPVVKCNQCGLTYVNPRISTEANNKYYEFALSDDHNFLDKHFLKHNLFTKSNLTGISE